MAESNLNNTGKKQQNKSKNPNRKRSSKHQQEGFEEESGSGTHLLQHGHDDPTATIDVDLVLGYARFDDKVRISLHSVRSKDEIRDITRKLVRELDQVRMLRKRIEERQMNLSFGNVVVASGSNRAGNLARVNSEASSVGPVNSRPVQGLTIQNNDHEERAGKMKKNPRNSEFGMGKEKPMNSGSNKKLRLSGSVAGGGGQRDGGGGMEGAGFGSGMDMYPKEFFMKCKDLLAKLMKHQYGWVFNSPVDAKKLKLHDYHKIIKHPVDLGTVKNKLSRHLYKSPKEFAEDVRLTFNNAMTYNEKGQDVHLMADLLLKVFEEKWEATKTTFCYDERIETGNEASLLTPAFKRGSTPSSSGRSSTHVLNPTPPPCMLLETSTLARSEFSTIPFADNQGPNTLKKLKVNDYVKRDMTFEEKQRLSIRLQDLPSDKLEGVVEIIKERNPEVLKEDEEIEADIESFDKETLWELDRYVTDHERSLSNNKREVEAFCFDERIHTGNDAISPMPTLKRGSMPPASGHFSPLARDPTPPQHKPPGTRTVVGSESSTIASDSRSIDAKNADNQGPETLKKLKVNDYAKRDMTFEEKQRLSIRLQNLPSDKVEGVVQIIKETNPEIVKGDEEIEADIESLDRETLWELDMYLTAYERSLRNNKREAGVALQTREETVYDGHDGDMTFSQAELQKEAEAAVDGVAASSSPVQRRKLENNMGGSGTGSSSSSSGSDSDSSSGSRSFASQ